jgi:hypothetical protein
LLIARSCRAVAETQIRATLSGLDESSAWSQKVDQQEPRASALDKLESTSVEQRFAELKAKKTAPSLPAAA